MATKQVTIPEIGEVTLYKRRGNHSLRLSVSHDGQVRVSMPSWLPYKAGEEFAIAKKQWILSQNTQPQPVLEHGHFIGKAHRVYFEPKVGSNRVSARVLPTEIRISHPKDLQTHHEQVQKSAHRAGIRALRQEAERLLPGRLANLASSYKFHYNSVQVKQMKSRWGSCSSTRDITLNLYLMQLPWHLIDYVLLHELTHTEVMQHGKPFWNVLERHLPNARQLKHEINTYQPVLMSSDNAMA